MGVLTKLHLADFRNYQSLDLTFKPGINLFIGANGQGKSNLLEAIHYLSLLRSFRTTKISNLYRWTTGTFLIRGDIQTTDTSTTRLGVQYGSQRRLVVNRDPINLASDFIGRFFCVTFVPEDIQLVKGSATDRRRFLDILASQLYPPYLPALQAYGKALKARNTLLRADRVDPRQVRAYDQVLVDRGTTVFHYRFQLIDRLKQAVAQVAPELYPPNRQLTLRYAPTIDQQHQDQDAIAQAFHRELQQALDRDIARAHTQRGPHRDELHIYLDDKLLSQFGSEGQSRLAVLALKMAAGQLVMHDKQEDTVIWLVDDVVGELDQRARTAFFDCLARAHQAFVVATGKDVIQGLTPNAVFNVEAGTVIPQTDQTNPT